MRARCVCECIDTVGLGLQWSKWISLNSTYISSTDMSF
jgi:hypothetical protein